MNQDAMDLIDNALVALARRINKDEGVFWGELGNNFIWTCRICNKQMKFHYLSDFCDRLNEHAIAHIKEYKLLAFV
jgi:hypothetical protein